MKPISTLLQMQESRTAQRQHFLVVDKCLKVMFGLTFTSTMYFAPGQDPCMPECLVFVRAPRHQGIFFHENCKFLLENFKGHTGITQGVTGMEAIPCVSSMKYHACIFL